MQIVSITSQKGGVGKTTLAYNLAIAAAADGVPSILFDLDPQASAYAYHQRRLRAGGS
ncbi:MAG: ParA family protein, partial [Pseudomonadota bacterium]